MALALQALVIGVLQGLTEFLPISSSGHLLVVPYLLGWNDPLLESLPFTVMLHMGTLGALLVYFWQDWLRYIPAGFATVRDRSFRGDPDRRVAWLIVAATIPAAIAGYLLNDVIEREIRQPGVVALTMVVGAVILWLADRWGARSKRMPDLSMAEGFAVGVDHRQQGRRHRALGGRLDRGREGARGTEEQAGSQEPGGQARVTDAHRDLLAVPGSAGGRCDGKAGRAGDAEPRRAAGRPVV